MGKRAKRTPDIVDRSDEAQQRSGDTIPIWGEGLPPDPPRRARPPLRTDVIVVGAGIAGLTTAYLLAKAGREVVVLDEKPVAGGESGRTSAHLANAIDDRFSEIERIHGRTAARLQYESHAAAIDLIERIDREENLKSDFRRLDAFLFPGEGQETDRLKKELKAAKRAKVVGVEWLDRPHGTGAPGRPCIRFPEQARFQPLLYLRGLARALERMGVRICCGTRVTDLSGDGPVVARLANGDVVTGNAAVAATNTPTPINNWVGIYTKQVAYRTYMLGFDVPAGAVADALYWDDADPYHYARLVEVGRRTTLIVGGEDHRVGVQPKTDPFDAIERWSREWFPAAGRIVSRWSGQVQEPEDGVAFIGRVPSRGNKACYVITGDSGMGLTHGTLGAMLIRDLIVGSPNRWQELYSPRRKATRVLGKYLTENLKAAGKLGDYVKPGDEPSVRRIPKGSGAVIRRGLKKIAVYRDASGELHERSAICPHLKCIVRWNNLEKSWDCPCHGSRFTCTGGMIIGPSIDDLKPA